MPKLTRARFIDSVTNVWKLAQRNFEKDQRLHGCVIGVDAMGRQLMFMSAPEGDQRVLDKGIIPVPGRWTDNLDLFQHMLAQHKAVAAIMINEAWTVTGEYGIETLRMDIFPSEHPMKEEIVFVAGFWPREFVSTGFRAHIERDKLGNHPRLVGHEPLGDDRAVLLASWLADILPQPH